MKWLKKRPSAAPSTYAEPQLKNDQYQGTQLKIYIYKIHILQSKTHQFFYFALKTSRQVQVALQSTDTKRYMVKPDTLL